MALFTQRTSNNPITARNELKLVYKLSTDGEAQQIMLRGSSLKESTESLIQLSRCCF